MVWNSLYVCVHFISKGGGRVISSTSVFCYHAEYRRCMDVWTVDRGKGGEKRGWIWAGGASSSKYWSNGTPAVFCWYFTSAQPRAHKPPLPSFRRKLWPIWQHSQARGEVPASKRPVITRAEARIIPRDEGSSRFRRANMGWGTLRYESSFRSSKRKLYARTTYVYNNVLLSKKTTPYRAFKF